MLDSRRLRAWHAVVSTGSITQAAAELGYSPSAVSQQIAALQRETGTTLLEPAGRGIRPTPAGEMLAERADGILGQLARAEEELAAFRAGQIGNLRVASFASAGAELVPRALAAVRGALPKIEINLRSLERPEALALLSRGAIDIALIESHPWIDDLDDTGLTTDPLLTDPYRIVLPRAHPLARRRSISLTEGRADPWIDLRCEVGCCRTATTAAFQRAGFDPAWIAEADDYWPAQGFVAAGLGLALIPQLALGVTHAGVVVRRLHRDNEPSRDILSVTRPAIRDTPTVDAMLAALTSAAHEQPEPSAATQ